MTMFCLGDNECPVAVVNQTDSGRTRFCGSSALKGSYRESAKKRSMCTRETLAESCNHTLDVCNIINPFLLS